MKTNFSFRSLSPFAILLVFLIQGCSAPRPEVVHDRNRLIPLDERLVETAALHGHWSDISNHLNRVDISPLPRSKKAYYYFWLGTSHYYQGMRKKAREEWVHARRIGPSPEIADQLNHVLNEIGEPGYSSSLPAYQGQWVVQLGIYSVKKTAEDKCQRLIWQGFDAKISPKTIDGNQAWAIWMGPYSAGEAEQMKKRLQKKDYKVYVHKASASGNGH